MPLVYPVVARVKSLADAGIYLHFPFCTRRCAYCNFYSCVYTPSVLKDYTVALNREIVKWGGEFRRPIDTVYIGGGTPSLLGENIRSVMDTLFNSFSIKSDAEITCEINPDAGDGFLKAAKDSGVNRISMGVQSADDAQLKVLGRTHTFDDARNTFYRARQTGFDNISLDLMICLPNGNADTLERTLDEFLLLNPEHISAYMLKIEPKTKFFASDLQLPDEDEQERQYLNVCDTLENAGYTHYEISNFAKPSFESRHNLKYWRLDEYLGIGPAAHSMVDGKRFYYPDDIRAFIRGNSPVFEGDVDFVSETVMLSLRLIEGIPIDSLSDKDFAMRLEKADLATVKNGRFSLTDRGMLVSNSIISELI